MTTGDRNRHAATGRFRAPRERERARGLPQVYGGRGRRSIRNIYEADHAHANGNRFRWLISTCLAAMVGTVVIGVVVYGSLSKGAASNSLMDQISITQEPIPTPLRMSVTEDGLNWATPKSDRLRVASGALTARYTIHEQVQIRRHNRPFIQIRQYLRLSMRLVPAAPSNHDIIPAFNPFKLYATSADDDRDRKDNDANQGTVQSSVVELLGGILPGDDGQELDNNEVRALVREVNEASAPTGTEPSLDRVGVLPGNLTPEYLTQQSRANSERAALAEATTVLKRTVSKTSTDDAGNVDQSEIRELRVGKPTSLGNILRQMGATPWQSRAMEEAAASVIATTSLSRGQQVRARLVPHAGHMEPEAFAVFGPLNDHLVTVKRSDGGEFVATEMFDPRVLMTAASFDNASATDASIYASIYDAALSQKLDPDEIMQLLRINAYDIDFRKRVQDGDQMELFYELQSKPDGSTSLGELLYVALATGGNQTKFWRFRSQDGEVEYYDEDGHNSKKFLMRKPVRGANVRLTSGFGYRRHPILGVQRMHTGADWAASSGTPILAAGRGIIEVAKRRGTNGNYVRIKHANGYQTAYSHMRNFAPGIRPGVKVRQGQLIGYVGTTGLSSGPHLHYEMLVNNRFVNPIKVRSGRAKTLKGKEMRAFLRERQRIESLLHQSPVLTASR